MSKVTDLPVATPEDGDKIYFVDTSDTSSDPAGTSKQADVSVLSRGYGWATYNDTQYTSGSPLAVTASTRTQLPNNASTATIDRLTGVFDGHSFVSSNEFVPRASGDAYLIRLSFQCRSSVTNASVDLELDIGGSQGVIYEDRQELDPNASTYRLVTFSIPIFALDTFIANNGQFFIQSDQALDIHTIVMFVIPLSA